MTKLFWIDLEMTGLDVKKERIIEVAAIITDLAFNEIETYSAVVKQDQKFLDGMDEWNTRTHKESGLTALVPQGKEQEIVEKELLYLINKHFVSNERPVLAGNSISQDRLFIDEYMKSLSSRLHYRMLDVTSWKVIFANKFNIQYKKKNAHRAVDDIRESIGELQHYISHINVS